MCRILSVSRSGFYNRLKRGKSQREQENEDLIRHIRQIYSESHGTYGSPRMTEALRQDGIRCNKKRVARLMRINGIVAKTKRKFKVITHSNHRRPVTNNLIKGDFTAPHRIRYGLQTSPTSGQGRGGCISLFSWTYVPVVS